MHVPQLKYFVFVYSVIIFTIMSFHTMVCIRYFIIHSSIYTLVHYKLLLYIACIANILEIYYYYSNALSFVKAYILNFDLNTN